MTISLSRRPVWHAFTYTQYCALPQYIYFYKGHEADQGHRGNMAGEDDQDMNLCHTIQADRGKVVNEGNPVKRGEPFLKCGELDNILHSDSVQMDLEGLKSCVEKNLLPSPDHPEWFKSCVIGCTRNVNIEQVKNFFISGKRLDNEVTASIIISMLGGKLGAEPVPHLKSLFDAKACLWSETSLFKTGADSYPIGSGARAMHKIIDKMSTMEDLKHVGVHHGLPAMDFLELLKRIRKADRDRSLNIPDWVYMLAKCKRDQISENAELIIISHKALQVLQRWLLAEVVGSMCMEEKFLSKATQFQKKALGVASVDEDGRIVTDHIRPILESKDPLVVAFLFCCLQRKLQTKVVKTGHCNQELNEEVVKCQNESDIFTTFQRALLKLIATRSDGLETDMIAFNCLHVYWNDSEVGQEYRIKRVLEDIHEICLTLEDYVSVFGKGKFENLHPNIRSYEQRSQVVGGKVADNRGPVNAYNSLCISLDNLCKEYLEITKSGAAEVISKGQIPGHIQRFRTMAEMISNDTFHKDAFYAGRVPGWFTYLQHHRTQ